MTYRYLRAQVPEKPDPRSYISSRSSVQGFYLYSRELELEGEGGERGKGDGE